MNYMLPSIRPDALLGMRQLQLMQMVPLPGKLAAAGTAARMRAEAALHLVAATHWEVRYDAATWFYERWAAQEQLIIVRETRRLLEDAAAIAAAMYRVGDGRQADVLRAHVEIARMDEEIVRMEAMSNSALARLAATLDISPEQIDAVLVLPEFPDVIPLRDSLELIALELRPLLAAAESETKAADADVALAARNRWPDLQVGMQYGERSTPTGTGRMLSFMLGASVPIWAGSRQLRMQDEAIAMEKMSRADLAAARADTRGRLGAVHTALSSSRRLASLYQTSVLPQSEAAAASALAAYRVGGVDFMTVVENRMTVNRYRLELVLLAAAEGRAWAELEMLAGVPLLLTSATNYQLGGAPQ
jgi:outer membrane protein TolC